MRCYECGETLLNDEDIDWGICRKCRSQLGFDHMDEEDARKYNEHRRMRNIWRESEEECLGPGW